MNKTAVYNFLKTFSTNSLILVCNIATGIITARLLLPEGRGSLAAVLFWPQIVSNIGLLNLHTVTTQRASKDEIDINKITVTSTCLAVSLSLITGLISYFLLPYLLGVERKEWLLYTRIYLIAFLPFNFIGLVLIAIEQARLNFTSYNLFRFLPTITYLLGLLLLWAFNSIRVENIIWFNWAGTFIVAIVTLIFARKRLNTAPSWEEAQVLLAIGSRLTVASLLSLVASQMDRMVIITFLDNKSIGIYAVALTFASSGLSIISSSFQSIILPKIAKEENISARRKILGMGLRYLMASVFISSLPLMLLAPSLIPFLFGDAFKGAIIPTLLLILAYFPMAMCQMVIQCLYIIDKPQVIVINAALTSLVFFISAWVLGYWSGLLGVILALLIANLVGLCHLLNYLNKQFELKIQDWWGLNQKTFIEVIDLGSSFLSKNSIFKS